MMNDRNRLHDSSDSGFTKNPMLPILKDRRLTCVTCGDSFVWTAGEQEFYAEKKFANPPKRCKACRKERAAAATNSNRR